jgi:hypothetical protein
MVGVFLPPNDQTYESQLVQILLFVRMEKPRELESTNQMTFGYHHNFYRPFLLLWLLPNPRHWKPKPVLELDMQFRGLGPSPNRRTSPMTNAKGDYI